MILRIEESMAVVTPIQLRGICAPQLEEDMGSRLCNALGLLVVSPALGAGMCILGGYLSATLLQLPDPLCGLCDLCGVPCAALGVDIHRDAAKREEDRNLALWGHMAEQHWVAEQTAASSPVLAQPTSTVDEGSMVADTVCDGIASSSQIDGDRPL